MLWPPVSLESCSRMLGHTHLMSPELESKLNFIPVQVPWETDASWNIRRARDVQGVTPCDGPGENLLCTVWVRHPNKEKR